MAPVLRPTDRPFGMPGAPRGATPAAPGPGRPMAGPSFPAGPPMAAGAGAPAGAEGLPPDPAAMQQQALLALLAEPVPDTVTGHPAGVDTTPRPYFPADDAKRARRPQL